MNNKKNNEVKQETSDSREQFFVDKVSISRQQTTFVLNASKNSGGAWYNQIVFDFNEGLELKQIMMGLFQEGRPFDFNVIAAVGPSRCKIDTITRSFGRQESA
ncbi:MAG: hypothetical protein QG657_2929 [Acidobacteriota bacterium]|jgi:hypothetical protein|nr:hypothetical protein [Acidobacteriota bacterium]